MNVIDEESEPYELGLRPLFYVPWLLWEIAKANLHVARVILTPSLPVHPRLLRIRATQKSNLGRVILANSITLTPGTVTLDVRDGTLLVHALTPKSADGLLSGDMDRRVTQLEGAEGER
jgi:multicomponent Na+:H+ antiporter subunit E